MCEEPDSDETDLSHQEEDDSTTKPLMVDGYATPSEKEENAIHTCSLNNSIRSDDEFGISPDRVERALTTKVWLVGDACLAPYSGDERYYNGRVKEILKEGSSTRVKVCFDGYTSDQDEVVESFKICPKFRKKESGLSNEKRVCLMKKSDIEIESYWEKKDKYMRMKYDCSEECKEMKALEQEHRLIPATQELKKNLEEWQRRLTEEIREKDGRISDSFANYVTKSTDNELGLVDNATGNEMPGEGFSDKDYEKPHLEVEPTCKKLPFILDENKERGTIQVPAVINQYLREYQRQGVKFMFDHMKHKEGCILGDDMGLGKTVQTIALISAMLGKTGNREDLTPSFLRGQKDNQEKKTGSFLIVSPSSVMFNWEDELETWGYFKVAKFHGACKMETVERAKKRKLEVVLTTYETLRNHVDTINELNWCCVIFDEAHKVKEPNAQVTKASKKMKCRNRIGLTGTPMQNNMEELWCLLDWANPNCLGSLEAFIHKFVAPIKLGQRFDATKRELALARKRQQEFGLLRDKWILRRTKDLLGHQLPQKDERVAFAPLTELQTALYKRILEFPEPSYLITSEDLCDCGSAKSRSKCCYKLSVEKRHKFKKNIFQYLTLLRKVSNHAALLLPFHKASDAQRKMALSVCKQLFTDFPLLREVYEEGSFTKMSDTRFCGKMKVLDQLLEMMKKANDKVLLFSTSVQLLNILAAYAISRGYAYQRLDGETKPERRISVVREFNNNPDIFLCLISTTAGGLGLNLTGANRVIIFDPAWNPSCDGQAQDRAYRIGQHRNVRVYRLITSGSIEENIYLRQVYKQQLSNIAIHTTNERRLFNAVAGCRSMPGKIFGIKNIFALKENGSNLTDEIINRAQNIEALLMVPNQDPKSTSNTLEKDVGGGSKSELTDDDDEYDNDELTDDNDYNDASQIIQELKRDIVDYVDNTCSQLETEDAKMEWPPLSSKYFQSSSNRENDCLENFDMPGGFTKTVDIVCKKAVDSISESTLSPKKRRKKIKKKKENSIQLGVENQEIANSYELFDEMLDKCGVGYTSVATKTVMQRNEAEEKMTSKAIEDVYWHGLNSQKPAYFFDFTSSEESDDIPCTATPAEGNTGQKPPIKVDVPFSRKRVFERIGGDMFLIGETPSAIRKEHFREIAVDAGFATSFDLAKEMLHWTQDKVVDTVMGFYKIKEPLIESVSSFPSIYSTSNREIGKTTHSIHGKPRGSTTNPKNRARNQTCKSRNNHKHISKMKSVYSGKREGKKLKRQPLPAKTVFAKPASFSDFTVKIEPPHTKNIFTIDCEDLFFCDNQPDLQCYSEKQENSYADNTVTVIDETQVSGSDLKNPGYLLPSQEFKGDFRSIGLADNDQTQSDTTYHQAPKNAYIGTDNELSQSGSFSVLDELLNESNVPHAIKSKASSLEKNSEENERESQINISILDELMG